MMETSVPLVLDTHIWFWLATGDPELIKRKGIKSLLAKISEFEIHISAITPWEIGMLEAKQRLVLRCDCLNWLTESICKTGVRIIPLTTEISVEATHLPGRFHGDPADRIIVASARQISASLLTRDRQIIDYAAEGYIDVLVV